MEDCALVPFDYRYSEIEMRHCNLASLVKGSLYSEEEELQHVAWGWELQGVGAYDVTVPALTLTSVLDQHTIQGIDFFSLDLEGFELGVLKGIDFDRYRPTFMVVKARDRLAIY